MRLSERLGLYARLTRLDRPIGSLLLLWPTLWALWIAGAGRPDPRIVTVFIVGTFSMRAAGCVVNDLADRKVDPQVERTRDRPLATGAVSVRKAVILCVLLSLASLALVMSLHRLTIALAGVGAVLAATYPLFKRFTHFPQAYLGIAFGWGIPMAFAAELGRVPPLGWLLLGANIAWVMAYDTFYAMVDRPDDLRMGVKSTAVRFGHHDLRWIGAFQVLTLVLLALVGIGADLDRYYYAGLGVAAGFAAYQQLVARERETAACFRAFLNNTWFGAAVFTGILLAYL
jgi:4-hydroxybenzoate polyprenyltransferase